MRTNKVLKNTIYGGIGYALNLFLSFFARSVFIIFLGVEYNGVNSLFNGILNALNLAELGFASAVAYSLYKPLNCGDEKNIATIMNYLQKIYRGVALIVLAIGVCCIPFLQYLIKEDISDLPFSLLQLRIYFSIFLSNTVCSYFLAYKRTLLTADQNIYIINNVDNASNIVLNIIQIVTLWLTKNYYAFLFVMLAKTIINNIILQIIANHKYKFLKLYKNEIISNDEKQAIIKNVKALMLHKVSSMIVLNSVTILISALVGVTENGLYSNYVLITNGVTAFVNILINAIVASVGNYCVEATIEKQFELFKKINYLITWISFFTFTCYICLFNPFITLWLDESMLFSFGIVILISATQSLQCFRRSLLIFRDAKGLFQKDKYISLIEAIVSIVLALLGGAIWGVFGILLGYLIASLFIALPGETYVLFKYGFNKSSLKFCVCEFAVVALCFVVSLLISHVCMLIHNVSIVGFIWKMLICVGMSNIIFLFSTFWMEENKYFRRLMKSNFMILKNKIAKK